MGDFVLELVRFVERGGKAAAIVVIAFGVVLIPTGLWLTFSLPGVAPPDANALVYAEEGERLVWPIMSVVSLVGLAFVGVGAGALFGAQRRVNAFLHGSSATSDASEIRAVDDAGLPFWVCGDCRVVEAGVSVTRRCVHCGSVASFVPVESDDERGMARAVLG